MVFEALLRELVEKVPGGRAGLLVGVDGIPVETYVAPSAAIDPQQTGAEYAGVLAVAQRAAEALGTGRLEELSLATERGTLLVRMVTPDYFLALAVAPAGHRGRGRFALRLASLRLAAELA